MTRRWIAAVAASVLVAAVSHASRAEDAKAPPKPDNEFANRLYDADVTNQEKTYACFVREYDSAHLAKHSAQQVRAMKLLVTAEQIPEDENVNHSFSLGVKFRHRPGNFSSYGHCGHLKASEDETGKEHLGCSVECDGGGLDMELTADAKAIIVRPGSIRIWKDKDPDDDHFHLDGGADDKVFRLDRAALEMCKSLVTDRDELAAMRAQAKKRVSAAK